MTAAWIIALALVLALIIRHEYRAYRNRNHLPELTESEVREHAAPLSTAIMQHATVYRKRDPD